MADDKNQVNESNPVREDARELAGRRTVIKGLASAVPVIMTVSSGEALANASTLQCIQEPPYTPPKCIGKNQQDDWYRQLKWVQNSKKDWVQKNCLVYVDQWGKPLSKDAGGKPFTHSCYNSFLYPK